MRIDVMRSVVCFAVVLGVLCVVSCALSTIASAQVSFPGGWPSSSILVSADLIGGKLHVVKRTPSNLTYCNGGGPADSITKYIYAASNGVVVLEKKVQGNVVPPSTTPERIEWSDEIKSNVEMKSWIVTNATIDVASMLRITNTDWVVSSVTNFKGAK